MAFEVWGDSKVESEWFRDLEPRLARCTIYSIGDRATNPKHIESLILYDRPDIILCRDGEPILVLEKTREVPTGHNIGQRLGRIVRALECKTPAVTLLPFRARKHGLHTGICEINVRVLRAAARMGELHSLPCLFLGWPVDSHGELIGDGSKSPGLKSLVAHSLDQGLELSAAPVVSALKQMESHAHSLETARAQYTKPPASVEIQAAPVAVGIAGHRRVCVYTIEMTPASCRREDPYTGMQFLYDYLYCRNGTDVVDKKTALVLRFPRLTKKQFMDANPNDPRRKSSLWYATANELWFSDGKIVLR
jgi:hypothetical protein